MHQRVLKRFKLTVLFVFFTLSISVAIFPCGIINVHGLFGEVTTYGIIEDTEQEIVSIKEADHEKCQITKGINIINIWFELLIMVVCISFCANFMKLPRGDTVVTLKVRVDN